MPSSCPKIRRCFYHSSGVSVRSTRSPPCALNYNLSKRKNIEIKFSGLHLFRSEGSLLTLNDIIRSCSISPTLSVSLNHVNYKYHALNQFLYF